MKSNSKDPITRSHQRDEYIMAQALIYAIKYIDSLPYWLQEPSNQNDMKLILLTAFPQFSNMWASAHKLPEEKPENMSDDDWSALLKHRELPNLDPR